MVFHKKKKKKLFCHLGHVAQKIQFCLKYLAK